MRTILCFLVVLTLSFTLVVGKKVLSDEDWLKSTDDIQPLAEAAIKEMKRTSSIHLYDDISLLQIVHSQKKMAAYSRSLLLKLRVGSSYFKSTKLEEELNVMVLQHKQNGKYSFAIPNYPEMQENYIHHQEEVWAEKHRKQRDAHFSAMENELEIDEFENQDFTN